MEYLYVVMVIHLNQASSTSVMSTRDFKTIEACENEKKQLIEFYRIKYADEWGPAQWKDNAIDCIPIK